MSKYSEKAYKLLNELQELSSFIENENLRKSFSSRLNNIIINLWRDSNEIDEESNLKARIELWNKDKERCND